MLISRSAVVGVEPVRPEVAAAAVVALGAVEEESAYGDLLLALVARARDDGVDLEAALRAAARRYRAAVRTAEGLR